MFYPQDVFEELSDFLSHISAVFKSSSSGVIPSTLKSAVVQPLLKRSNHNTENCNNFRPFLSYNFLQKYWRKWYIINLYLLWKTTQFFECFNLVVVIRAEKLRLLLHSVVLIKWENMSTFPLFLFYYTRYLWRSELILKFYWKGCWQKVVEYALLGFAEFPFHTELDTVFCPIVFPKLF